MSSYFDATSRAIAETPSSGLAADHLRDLEAKLVFDVTVCAQFDTFPLDLRQAIHKVVLAHGVSTLPSTAYPADFETLDEHKQRLIRLSEDLHTVFHEAARRGHTDHPLTPLRRLYAQGEEEREAKVLTFPGFSCARCPGVLWGSPQTRPLPCPRCGAQDTVEHVEGQTLLQLQQARGYDLPCWTCPGTCDTRWAAPDTDPSAAPQCPHCHQPGLHEGFTLGDAARSGMERLYPRRSPLDAVSLPTEDRPA